jgi:hypothetical protein
MANALELIERLWNDPPQVHETGRPDSPIGIWNTERGCYELIASWCGPGDRTLETGLGLSTALFASLGTSHTTITPSQGEVDRFLEYCDARDISTADFTPCVGFSDDLLPALEPGELSVLLIDGGHGFPMPMIDWFYGARHLRTGGLCVVDDVQLHPPALLEQYLDMDPLWRRVDGNAKWAAWERVDGSDLRRDHWQEPFLVGFASTRPSVPQRLRWRAEQAVAAARERLGDRGRR